MRAPEREDGEQVTRMAELMLNPELNGAAHMF